MCVILSNYLNEIIRTYQCSYTVPRDLPLYDFIKTYSYSFIGLGNWCQL